MTVVTGLECGIGYTNSIKNLWAELKNYVLDDTFNEANKTDITARPYLDVLSSPVGESSMEGAFPAYSSVYLNFKNNNSADLVGLTDFNKVTVSLPARIWAQDAFATGMETTLTEREFKREKSVDTLATISADDIFFNSRPNFYFREIPQLQYLRLGAASPSAVNKNNSTVFILVEDIA